MKRFILLVSVVLFLSAGMARGAAYFDVTVGVSVNEDSRIFLNVANETWRPPVPATFIRRCADPEDDFPVIAFLAYHSHRNPSFILNLRQEGYGWADIFYQLNVNPRVLFVGIDRDPGPPYGRAWGNWSRNRGHGSRGRYRLSDRDVVALVKVQTAARHFGTNPYQVIEAQDGGRHVEVYTANRWRERNGRETWDRDGGRDRRHRDRRGDDDDHRDRRDRHGDHEDDRDRDGRD